MTLKWLFIYFCETRYLPVPEILRHVLPRPALQELAGDAGERVAEVTWPWIRWTCGYVSRSETTVVKSRAMPVHI
jgi:hypothetical protein